MNEIKYRDNVYALTITSSAFTDDDSPGEYLVGVFDSAKSAANFFNDLFGCYSPEEIVPFGDFCDSGDALLIAEDPFHGVFSATIQRLQFGVIDETFAAMVLKNSLRAMRAEHKEMVDQKAVGIVGAAKKSADNKGY